MAETAGRKRVVIMGAAGRDFHNFNVVYRDDPDTEVIAFTATQIPGIVDRRYPPALSGPHYPDGIPIEDEAALEQLCRTRKVSEVAFAYSDITHETVMHCASRVLSSGASFKLLGPAETMLKSNKPVISVTAVRTGCGKSHTSRYIGGLLLEKRLRFAALRHPMPYGNLLRERVQRFASLADLDEGECTNEEREEYEPYIEMGGVIFAGVDYVGVLAQAEREADIIIWDGGNNDFSFLEPDLSIVLVDALRPHQLTTHHPGETALRMADIVIVNKVDAAPDLDLNDLRARIREINPDAEVIYSRSPVRLDDPELVRGRSVMIVEDGPTLTHGGMSFGAGYVAAKAADCGNIIDPRQSASPAIKDVFDAYPHIGPVLPAVGYTDEQLEGLRQTIEQSAADVVLIATPFDLARHLKLEKPVTRVTYAYADAGEPRLAATIDRFVTQHGLDNEHG